MVILPFPRVHDVKVLGLIGSARKLGNCEVLVKEALMAAREKGAEVRAVRLTDYRLLPCKGCMACVFRGEPCRLDDDMHQLWEQLQWADGLILSAPTYFLGPSGIIKLLIDRLFEYSLALGQARRRPAAIIATAGLPQWNPFTMPLLTMLAGVLQLEIVDRMVAYRPGPAEVLLDEETMNRAAALGRQVAEAPSSSDGDLSSRVCYAPSAAHHLSNWWRETEWNALSASCVDASISVREQLASHGTPREAKIVGALKP